MADAIPDAETLASAAKLEILNVKGEKVTFGSIFETQKTIVVFIRAIFPSSSVIFSVSLGYHDRALLLWTRLCTQNCQDYVEQLATVPSSALANANTQIAVVGCGDWQPIQSYAGQYLVS
ncbi:hypothetical protein H0H81_009522 [Sphagnurus paluster]|uniref:Uncharacterized protein n=1 Tax=Sphagnurus paluster TaxID=117069 RepID=A0A9P7FS33_9AGAR|nr:hypothetical protein H0H81_009522 [Sphagnurus paluster]